MSNPKRQHYVPSFYLDFFASGDGTFWVYDKEGDLPRKQTAINTAVESFFYSVDTPEGEKNNYIEEELSKIESTARPILALSKKWVPGEMEGFATRPEPRLEPKTA